MAKSPFKMKGFSGFKSSSSPLHQEAYGPTTKPMLDENKNRIPDTVESIESKKGIIDKPTIQNKQAQKNRVIKVNRNDEMIKKKHKINDQGREVNNQKWHKNLRKRNQTNEKRTN